MVSRRRPSFVQLCLAGRAMPADIERFVERWHNAASNLPLHEFLGLTWDEYQLWVEKPASLDAILALRHPTVTNRR